MARLSGFEFWNLLVLGLSLVLDRVVLPQTDLLSLSELTIRAPEAGGSHGLEGLATSSYVLVAPVSTWGGFSYGHSCTSCLQIGIL